MRKSKLQIRLIRLPDINTDAEVTRHRYSHYGRFSILQNSRFWFADAISSHPMDTKIGWYWALSDKGELLVSGRGAAQEGNLLFSEYKNTLLLLIDELARRRYISKPMEISFSV